VSSGSVVGGAPPTATVFHASSVSRFAAWDENISSGFQPPIGERGLIGAIECIIEVIVIGEAQAPGSSTAPPRKSAKAVPAWWGHRAGEFPAGDNQY